MFAAAARLALLVAAFVCMDMNRNIIVWCHPNHVRTVNSCIIFDVKWPNADRFVQVTHLQFGRDKHHFAFPGQDGPETANVFPGTTRYLLPFNSTYWAMEKSAGATRGSINLGMGELVKAIQALCDKHDSALASSMLIFVQMISEAVRYRYTTVNNTIQLCWGHCS